MPRMELRNLPSGEPFYYNTESGGALSGFGTIRLWNTETANNLSIYFNSSNAHVDNAGSNVNIYNDYSNCMIWSSGSNVNIQLSQGISTLINSNGSNVQIKATGSAPCWIATTGDKLVTNLDSGDDFVGNAEGGVVTNSKINMGAGKDTVNIGGGGSNIEIDAGENDDYVGLSSTSYTKVAGGNGVDTIAINGGHDIQVSADGGNDFVWCFSDSSIVTISGGDGADEISNYGTNVTIWGGNDKDSIFNWGKEVFINAGDDESDDEINNSGSHVTINAGLGNDLIIIHEGSNITAYGGRGNDNINIYGGSNNVVANAGAGNDIMWCTSECSFVTMNGGDGDDQFSNSGNFVSINAGADNDVIETSGISVTVRGGTGDDRVNLGNNFSNSTPYIFDYSNGDGNDVVNKYGMIYLRDGAKVADMKFDGNDIIYYIGDGSIRIVDGVNGDPQHPGYFYIPNNNLPANFYTNLPLIGVDYLKNKIYENIDNDLDGFLSTFDDGPMKSILEDGAQSPYLADFAAEDAKKIAEFIKGAYKNARDIQYMRNSNDVTPEYYQQNLLNNVQLLNDRISLLGNISPFLEKYGVKISGFSGSPAVGIIGAFAGFAISALATGSAIKDFNKRYPNAREDAWREVIGDTPTFLDKLNLSNRIKVNGIVRSVDPDRYDKANLAIIDMGAGYLALGAGLLAVAIGGVPGAIVGLVLAGGISAADAAAKTNYLQKVNGSEQNYFLTFAEQSLGLNYGTVKNWLKGKNNGESYDLAYNYVITNSVVNAISADVTNDGTLDHATLTGSAENDTLVNSGDYSLIEGYNGDNVVINAGDNSTITTGEGNDSIINIGDYSMLVVGAGNDTVENGGKGVTIDGGEGDDYIENVGNSVVINSGNGADYIDNTGNSIQINTGAGDDDVENFGNNVIINTEDGVDYIIDFGSSNSINAGSGDDFIDIKDGYNNIITYADGEGNDTIYGYNESDIINLTSGTVRNTVASGEDLILNFDTNHLTLKNAANLHVTYLTGLDSSSAPPLLKSEGFYNYTGGSRKIENYSSEDKIKLASDYTGIGIAGNSFVIKSSTGALTLENVRDKVIDVTDSNGNTAAYVYMFSEEGFVDGAVTDKYEVIVGSDSAKNHLKAGNFGSSLIGGKGDNTLTGGDGQDSFVYKASIDVIRNYQSGEIISFAASYTGWTTDGNDLVINAAEGSLRISEATNKLVEIAGADGNIIAHVYKAENYEGIIDGRVFDKFEVIVGSDNLSNQIFANEVGSSLWGGRGNSNDDLYGNIGTDEYIYAYGNGQDNIYQAGSEDTVNLLNISLSQITGAEITENGVNIQFADGGSLNISGQVGAFKLEGQVYHADYQNKTWS